VHGLQNIEPIFHLILLGPSRYIFNCPNFIARDSLYPAA